MARPQSNTITTERESNIGQMENRRGTHVHLIDCQFLHYKWHPSWYWPVENNWWNKFRYGHHMIEDKDSELIQFNRTQVYL